MLILGPWTSVCVSACISMCVQDGDYEVYLSMWNDDGGLAQTSVKVILVSLLYDEDTFGDQDEAGVPACLRACVPACLCLRACVPACLCYVYAYVHVHVHVYLYVYVHAYVYVHVYV